MASMKIVCPDCTKASLANYSGEAPKSFTADCAHCGLLLLVENGIAFDFHKKLNESNPQWPADGKGTAYVEI